MEGAGECGYHLLCRSEFLGRVEADREEDAAQAWRRGGGALAVGSRHGGRRGHDRSLHPAPGCGRTGSVPRRGRAAGTGRRASVRAASGPRPWRGEGGPAARGARGARGAVARQFVGESTGHRFFPRSVASKTSKRCAAIQGAGLQPAKPNEKARLATRPTGRGARPVFTESYVTNPGVSAPWRFFKRSARPHSPSAGPVLLTGPKAKTGRTVFSVCPPRGVGVN